MKFGSLFTGVGGFDIGVERAGWECAWQVEWNKDCQQTLMYHWPNVPKMWDVCDVNGADIDPVDVITFGSPCQDLSVAGRREGLSGSRSVLFFEATRIIEEMRNATGGAFPRYAIWENVAGALTSRNGDDFEAVLKEMARLGPHFIEWAVLDAQFFGIPQRRRRVFLVACFDPTIAERSGPKVLAIGHSRRGHTQKSRQTWKAPAAEIEINSGEHGGGGPGEIATGADVANCISAGIYHNGSVVNQDIDQGHLVIEQKPIIIDRAAFNQGQNALYDVQIEEVDVCPSLVARGPHAVAYGEVMSFDTQFGSNAAIFLDQSPTLKATQQSPSIFRNLHVRRLSPIECERLMGYPDDHTKYRSDGKENSPTARFKMCGNGVASPVAEWIANQINLLEEAPAT